MRIDSVESVRIVTELMSLHLAGMVSNVRESQVHCAVSLSATPLEHARGDRLLPPLNHVDGQ